MSCAPHQYTSNFIRHKDHLENSLSSPGELSLRDFDSVGLGGTYKIAFLLRSQMPTLLVHKPHFENHYSTLPHSLPLVLVPSHHLIKAQ